jgi:signal transduction histidine kinase
LRIGSLPHERLRAIDLELGRATLALEDLASVRAARAIDGDLLAWPIREERVDVTELLADSIEAWRAVAASRGVQLRWRRPDHEAAVVGERLRLAQALGNLIANAIEHGGGVVDVNARSEDAGVRIEVVDGGPGLPAPVTDLARRHRRGRGRLREAVQGRGRGLSIAGAIAVAHGGRLSAAACDRGARLVLELPLAAAEQLSAPAGS